LRQIGRELGAEKERMRARQMWYKLDTSWKESIFSKIMYIKIIVYSYQENAGGRLNGAHWKHVGNKYWTG
jgi:hypothetical protein